MTEPNIQDVLARAARLTRLEDAAAALDITETRWNLRAGMAAAVAAARAAAMVIAAAAAAVTDR